jgi:putative endonuclease
MSYSVYILKCSDATLYTGIAKDVQKRLDEHNNSAKGAKYTKARRPVQLLHVEVYDDRSSALKREFEIKRMKRNMKLKLLDEVL